MLHVQEFLQNRSLADLQAQLGIKAKRHETFSNLVLLVYDQIDSPKMDPVVRECRGLILDESNGWSVVARPFDRFLNWGEGAPQDWDIPLEEARIYKKEDGSLTSLYHYRGEWHVATKGLPDARGVIEIYGKSFQELFWEVFNQCGYTLPTDTTLTYVFELCSKYNRVVVPHGDNARLPLLTVRSNLTGEEYPPENFPQYIPVEEVEIPALRDIDSLREMFQTMPPLYNEGFVIAQYLNPSPEGGGGKVKRAKIKHPGYLALSRLKEGLSPKNLLDLIRTGEGGEFLAVFPEYTEQFKAVQDRYEALVQKMTEVYETNKGITSQKDFALALKESGIPLTGALFMMRKNPEKSLRSILAGVSLDTLNTALTGDKDA